MKNLQCIVVLGELDLRRIGWRPAVVAEDRVARGGDFVRRTAKHTDCQISAQGEIDPGISRSMANPGDGQAAHAAHVEVCGLKGA